MFSIGVDLGQRRDFSAVAVVERVEAAGVGIDHLHWMARAEGAPEEWVVRHLERMALGTPYTAVTARVVELARHAKVREDVRLVVDATGLGMPVVDMLRAEQALFPAGCGLTPVVITGGMGERYDRGIWYVPKLDLLARLEGLLEQKRLRIARRMRESGTLVRELTEMRTLRRASGRLRVGADGAGEHDDLALAVALAVWVGRKGKVGEKGRRLM